MQLYHDHPEIQDVFKFLRVYMIQPHCKGFRELDLLYREASTYKLSRNEQFIFMKIARTNRLRLPIHLMEAEPCTYEQSNK